MKALHGGRTQEFQHQYHLKRNDTPNFEQGQPGRIDMARMFIEKMLIKDLRYRPLRIVELGCGSGDVTGPYSAPDRIYSTPRGEIHTQGIEVIGVDVVPQAVISVGQRYPNMTVLLSPVESLQPVDCDLLVMTEFLEHVADPVKITRDWMPHARWALIGHPLNEPDPPYEMGHAWSYDVVD
jgi:2-polyprenyl-3-methyl-5-hydroxy-6-metoxy-1,4-benzoquinol methylase